MVQESVAAGADVVTFSGDKLLGGPQAGIIVGQASFIDRMRRHPLARALRVDKMTIAALQATLLHYAREEVTTHIPIWMMITRPLADIERTAQAWASALSPWATVMEGESTVGGGALPGEVLPTFVVAISLPEKSKGGEAAVQRLARSLRLGTPPIITRVERNALLLDPRTVLPGQEQVLLQRVRALLDTV
jgi:L-seryl-tRNA(Ser) seleniumtransferase